jgi:hypothetical protein
MNSLEMVGLGGLEPPTSSLSGMRSSQLSYRPKCQRLVRTDRTRRAGPPPTFRIGRSSQLSYRPKCQRLVGTDRTRRAGPPPTFRIGRSSQLSYRPRRPDLLRTPGGAGRDRTGDLLNANQALSQLSYSPKEKLIEASWMQGPARPARGHFKKNFVFQVEIAEAGSPSSP